ncbi:MAG TPA: flagellar basal body P-ring formation chaperone FlgA [Burkholderiales bacterium]|nr:flagellar basal body P-ring formation chaperone FlgA [Burkholderiales bacterium]
MRISPYPFFAALLLGLCASMCVRAQGIDEQSLKLYLEKESVGVNGRVEVKMGQLDPRLRLAPCAKIEPFIPAGTRLWGRSNIGIRCVEGASWSTYLPIHVRIYAPAVVAARPLSAGQEVLESDVRLEEIELTRERPGVFTDPAQLAGRLLMRQVDAGQALRADQTRLKPVIKAGDTVKLSYSGTGFNVSVDGKALSTAADGQSLKVQIETGKILSGIARPGRIVEVRS